MDKLKRFIDIFVPTETCNLRCSYCYITQNRKFNGKLFEFDHTIDDIKKSGFDVKQNVVKLEEFYLNSVEE